MAKKPAKDHDYGTPEDKVIGANFKRLMAEKGLTQADMSERMDLSVPTISNLSNGKATWKTAYIESAKKALKCSSQDLYLGLDATQTGTFPAITPLNQIPVLGEVQAGVWKEAEQWGEDEVYFISVPVSDLYKNSAYALVISGDSMNKVFLAGDIVIVVPIDHYPKELITGRRVIVERRKRDGIVEATAKELVLTKGKAELWPRSTNPKYQTPIEIHWPHKPEKIDTETVEIKGVIVGSYRPEEA